ncbi:hypothetical protein, partial [Sphingobium yanoikuyae]|uniref:hypothetical protein n=1 Tax=Sphingobium yanoikuyae TaxID=13690 RepID=UPI001BDE7FE7
LTDEAKITRFFEVSICIPTQTQGAICKIATPRLMGITDPLESGCTLDRSFLMPLIRGPSGEPKLPLNP